MVLLSIRTEWTSDAGFVTTSIFFLLFFSEATYPMGENAEKAEQRSHVINKIAMIASGAGLVVLENIFFFVAPPLPLPCVVLCDMASALELKMANDVRKAPGKWRRNENVILVGIPN